MACVRQFYDVHLVIYGQYVSPVATPTDPFRQVSIRHYFCGFKFLFIVCIMFGNGFTYLSNTVYVRLRKIMCECLWKKYSFTFSLDSRGPAASSCVTSFKLWLSIWQFMLVYLVSVITNIIGVMSWPVPSLALSLPASRFAFSVSHILLTYIHYIHSLSVPFMMNTRPTVHFRVNRELKH